MEVVFGSRSLRRCYETHAEAVREWGPVVGRKYIMRVNVLYAAKEFSDLYSVRALRLHELKGQRKGQYAITVHDRWRLLLRRVADDTVRVEEVTKHYGD
jgi:proteic killer suppression protein